MEIDIKDFKRALPYEIGFDLRYIETIDCGSFGTVLHVFDKKLYKDIAIKVISKVKRSPSYINKIKEEISFFKKLDHPNIVKFYGFVEGNSQLLIKMEYIKYGTLEQWMKNQKKIFEEEASIILKNILSAIEYLHSKQICHRDLKPENIMLSRENDLNSIKIVDFGLSTQNLNKLINNDYCGTYIYMAPELIEKKLYFISVDIWSIGILMFMLLNKRKHPFYNKGDKREVVANKIKNGKLNFYEKITPLARHLILKLLEPNPSWRYTASQAIKHPWITRNFDDIPPMTFNELLIKSNNKKIMKDLFFTCLFLNYFRKKEDFTNLRKNDNCVKFIDENSNDEDEKNLNIVENDIFTAKFKEKTISITCRNKGSMNLKHKNFFNEKKNPCYQIRKNKNVLTLLQKVQIKKIKPYVKFKRQNSISIVNSKTLISKDINQIKSIEKRRSNSIETINFTPIKKISSNINQLKINEESKNKMTNLFQKNKNIHQHLSDRKIRNNLPRIHLKLPFKNSLITLNYNENSNCIPFVLPRLNYSTKKIKRIKFKT